MLSVVSHMMNAEQTNVVRTVYNRFIDSEDVNWTIIDDNLHFLGYMLDSDLMREASIKYHLHSHGVFRCASDHEQQFCFAPHILEAVGSIVELYEETGELHEKNRYIIEYYMSMAEAGMIYSSEASSL